MTLFLRCAAFLLSTLLLRAQLPNTARPAFKGHTIGESYAVFVSKGGEDYVSTCRSITPEKDAGRCQPNGRFEAHLAQTDMAFFDRGELIELKLFVGLSEGRPIYYEQVLRDMTSRMGQPTKTDVFGNKQGLAEWDRPDIFARIIQLRPNGEIQLTSIDVISQEERQRQLKKKAEGDAADVLK